MSTMPLARSAAASAAASIASAKSIVPTTSERFAGSATNGVATSRRLGPAVEVVRRSRGARARTSRGRRCRASTRPGRRAGSGSPARACCRSAPCASSRARSAARGRRAASGRAAPSSSSMRAIAAGLSSASQRPPSAPNALLRGEVVGVGLGDVDRQPAGARGGVDQDQGVAGALRARDRHHRPRSRSRCGPRRSRRRPGSAAAPGRRRARPRPRSGRRGTARGGRLRELRRELAVGQVQGALADQPGRGGVPEGGGAAVAERHLVAVGQREELGEPAAHPADQVADRRLAMRGPDQVGALGERAPAPRGAPSRARSRSGRRRASGSAGICAVSVIGGRHRAATGY